MEYIVNTFKGQNGLLSLIKIKMMYTYITVHQKLHDHWSGAKQVCIMLVIFHVFECGHFYATIMSVINWRTCEKYSKIILHCSYDLKTDRKYHVGDLLT